MLCNELVLLKTIIFICLIKFDLSTLYPRLRPILGDRDVNEILAATFSVSVPMSNSIEIREIEVYIPSRVIIDTKK
jgi:hypothetical protein